jgi:hypothetical protein
VNGNPVQVEGLEINEVVDGFIIYDSKTDRVHVLNHTAAFILQLCNGKHSIEEILEITQKAYSLPSIPEAEIREHVDRLTKEGLIRYD